MDYPWGTHELTLGINELHMLYYWFRKSYSSATHRMPLGYA